MPVLIAVRAVATGRVPKSMFPFEGKTDIVAASAQVQVDPKRNIDCLAQKYNVSGLSDAV
jgi:hypothetical protein